MDSEQKFWTRIWGIAAATLCAIVLTVGGCTMNQSSKVAELVKHGANPVAARCGVIGPSSMEVATCMAVGTKYNGS